MSECPGDTCLCCEYFYIMPDTPDYSEYTPGEPASLSCEKYHFCDINIPGDWSECIDFLREKRKECPDFVHRGRKED